MTIIHYASGIHPQTIPFTIPQHVYERVAKQFPEDHVNTRRLVKRVFETRGNENLCHEFVLTRTEDGWVYHTAIFHEGKVSPYPWNYNNTEPIMDGVTPTPQNTPTTHDSILIPSVYVADFAAEFQRADTLSSRHEKQNTLSSL